MKVIKENGEFGEKIFFVEDDKYISFVYAGNLDLYWSFHSKGDNAININGCNYFIITKENYGVYNLFEKLFDDVENIEIFNIEDSIPFFIDNDKEKFEYLENCKKDEKDRKNRCRLYNSSNYNELFDEENNVITWYSDETAREVANFLKIKKLNDIFKLEFYIQPYVKEYDRDFYSQRHIPIRFRNSGSRYDPFNIIFMRMYNQLKNIDDVCDVGHQIHIEEYLYNKEKVKMLKK